MCLCSALEKEGLDVPQPPKGHQQEGLSLRQLELSSRLRPCVWVGTRKPNCSLTTDITDSLTELRRRTTWSMKGLGGRGRGRGSRSGRRLSHIWMVDLGVCDLTSKTVHGLEGSTEAAKLQFSGWHLTTTRRKSCRRLPVFVPQRATLGPRSDGEQTFVFLVSLPCLFLSCFLDTRHLLSLDGVVNDGSRTAANSMSRTEAGTQNWKSVAFCILLTFPTGVVILQNCNSVCPVAPTKH